MVFEVKPNIMMIPLGYQGENESREIHFDVSEFREYGEGTFVLLHQRVNDEVPYPVNIIEIEDTIIWFVSVSDVDQVGTGKCQLQYVVDDVVAKTCIWATCVSDSLEKPGDVPEPESGWVTNLLEVIERIVAEVKVSPEQIEEAVTEYLDEHPVQPTPIDNTLQNSGEAADAKVTGDLIRELQEEIINLRETVISIVNEKEVAKSVVEAGTEEMTI